MATKKTTRLRRRLRRRPATRIARSGSASTRIARRSTRRARYALVYQEDLSIFGRYSVLTSPCFQPARNVSIDNSVVWTVQEEVLLQEVG